MIFMLAAGPRAQSRPRAAMGSALCLQSRRPVKRLLPGTGPVGRLGELADYWAASAIRLETIIWASPSTTTVAPTLQTVSMVMRRRSGSTTVTVVPAA